MRFCRREAPDKGENDDQKCAERGTLNSQSRRQNLVGLTWCHGRHFSVSQVGFANTDEGCADDLNHDGHHVSDDKEADEEARREREEMRVLRPLHEERERIIKACGEEDRRLWCRNFDQWVDRDHRVKSGNSQRRS